ncbi:glutamate racemase [bacterium]|nr:glutamate racemase [bacterium]
MKKELPIGFFDSGVGGLSVYSYFKKLLPNENTIYFGDLKNLPYGNKTQSELVQLAKNILNFFQTKKVKAVVIACNTSSALAYNQIKDDYDFKIYPIIQASAKVISTLGYEKIGIFATNGTVNSHAYMNEIKKYNSKIIIKEIACPNWVGIVEGLYQNKENDIKLHMQEMLAFNPQKIILGCTHYPYLIKELKKYASKDIFIDPARIFVNFIVNDINRNPSNTIGTEEFYVSANPEQFIKNASLFYKVNTQPKIFQ